MNVKRQCPICGKSYDADSKRLKFGRQTTCSRACSYSLRARKRSNRQMLICAVCGKQFSRSPAKIKGKYGASFCSRSCHYAGRTAGISRRTVTKPYVYTEAGRAAMSEHGRRVCAERKRTGNYGHSEATRRLLSKTTAAAIAAGKVPVISQIEYVVAEELRRRGFNFIHQYAIRDALGRFACVFDFLLPDLGLFLEVNGTYWHADPRFYPNGPINTHQRRTAASWERKTRMAASLGLPIVSIWEYDIRQNAAQAVSASHEALAG